MVPDGIGVGLAESSYLVIKLERPLVPTEMRGLMERGAVLFAILLDGFDRTSQKWPELFLFVLFEHGCPSCSASNIAVSP
jgi:hypothetical protein